MSFAEEFNAAVAIQEHTSLLQPSVRACTSVSIYTYDPHLGIYQHYDFAARILTTLYGKSPSTTPFSQLDREVLECMREKLIELGGKPPALPAEEKPGSIFPSKGL